MGNWGNDVEEEFQFLCKAAALPSSTITEIPVPFRGRILKVAGDRTFDTWTITVINDENFRIRSKFEQWMNGISKLSDGSGATSPGSYMLVLLFINSEEVLIKEKIQLNHHPKKMVAEDVLT